MSKIKAFLSKPITWGGYFKFYAGVYAISVAIMAGYLAWLTHKTWGKGSKEEEEEEKPAYIWTDED